MNNIEEARKMAKKPPHGIKQDITYNEDSKRIYRIEALTAKFSQPDMKQLLLATKDAQLLKFKRRSEPVMDVDLMEVRDSTSASTTSTD
jgi:hypothetical protein